MNLDQLEELAKNSQIESSENGCDAWYPMEYLYAETGFRHDSAYIAAMSPDIAIKLIKVARAAKSVSINTHDPIFSEEIELSEALKELES